MLVLTDSPPRWNSSVTLLPGPDLVGCAFNRLPSLHQATSVLFVQTVEGQDVILLRLFNSDM